MFKNRLNVKDRLTLDAMGAIFGLVRGTKIPLTAEQQKIKDKNKAQNKANKPKKFTVNEGMVWNPLVKYPPNRQCFCGKTTLKAKKCCLHKVKHVIPIEEANKLEAYMKNVEAE